MKILKDFEDLCVLLNTRYVDYLVVGGYALAFHGAPRFTGDLDIFIRPTAENVNKLAAALRDFGFGEPEIHPDDLLRERSLLQLGRPPLQVHIMAALSGISWETAWESRQLGAYGGAQVCYLGRDAFIANKRAIGRPKDLADIEALEDRGRAK